MQRKRTFAAGLSLLILIGFLAGCAGGSYKIFSASVALGTKWTMKYWKFQGSERHTIHVEGEGSCDIAVTVTTDSGTLSLSIEDVDGNRMYSGREIPTSTFLVEVPPGEYVVRVVAEDHSGGFSLDWGQDAHEDGEKDGGKGKTAA